MSKLTDKIAYLQGLAEGMKLNQEKDVNRLVLGILDVLGDLGAGYEGLADAHSELSEYVDSIDDDLAELEAELYDDEDEDIYEDGEDAEDDGDDEEDDDDLGGVLLYECPHCKATVELDPEDLDLEEEHPCPNCGKELFPELPEETDG